MDELKHQESVAESRQNCTELFSHRLRITIMQHLKLVSNKKVEESHLAMLNKQSPHVGELDGRASRKQR